MAMRTDLFREVDGFDEKLKDSRLLSADICLRVSELGYRIVFNPFAAFRQPRTNRRIAPSKGESDHFRAKWGQYFENDPFYNPNLSYDDGTFTINL
jgi:GT2 family glycosyltransferase